MTTETHPDPRPLSADELSAIHSWWRAANYLSVGQIYLLDNPSLREPPRARRLPPPPPRRHRRDGRNPGGLDALVFTAGVGENSPGIRASAAAGLTFLGVRIDSQLNDSAVGDLEITAADGAARTLVVRAREDLEIAAQVTRLLAGSPSS